MENIAPVIIGIVVFIGLFLLLREVVMWYYKINERIALMKEQNSLLKQLLTKSKFEE